MNKLYEELKTVCTEWMKTQPDLRREYIREWIALEDDWDYDDLSNSDRFCFNREEHDKFIEHFMDPFFEEHPEYDKEDDDTWDYVDEILRDEMYNQDKYECIIL